MAGIAIAEHDLATCLDFIRWSEAGLEFASNLISRKSDGIGGKISLHAHSYDHVSVVTHGWFQVEEHAADGTVKRYQMASKGFVPTNSENFEPISYRIMIPAWHKHEFTLIESHDQPGEVLCIWPSEK